MQVGALPIILDEPVSTHGEEGRNFQEVFKSFWYTAMKRYPEGQACALISDEFQEFGASSDAKFLSVSRSYRVAMIMATQNKASLVAKLDNIETDKILANTQVKIFFQSSDEQTWEFARKIMGVIDTNSYTEQYNTTLTTSTSSNQKFELLGQHFQQLGMHIDPSQAEAFVYNRGYIFKANGKKYLQVTFNKVDQVLQSDILELMPENKPDSKENQKNHDPKFIIQQILDREGRASTEPKLERKEVKIEELETQKDSADTVRLIQMEAKSVKNPEFMTREELMGKYKISQTTFRRYIKMGNIQTSSIKSSKGQMVNIYNQKEFLARLNMDELSLKNYENPHENIP